MHPPKNYESESKQQPYKPAAAYTHLLSLPPPPVVQPGQAGFVLPPPITQPHYAKAAPLVVRHPSYLAPGVGVSLSQQRVLENTQKAKSAKVHKIREQELALLVHRIEEEDREEQVLHSQYRLFTCVSILF